MGRLRATPRTEQIGTGRVIPTARGKASSARAAARLDKLVHGAAIPSCCVIGKALRYWQRRIITITSRCVIYNCIALSAPPRSRRHVRPPSLLRTHAGHRRRRARPVHRLAPGPPGPAACSCVDKTAVAAGASGIACGVIRNNYFQPAMSELMAACVEVWESDPEALHYHPSGYIALGPAGPGGATSPRSTSASSGSAIPPSCTWARARWPRTCARCTDDWRAPGLTVCLHEHAGGFAFNQESMHGLADQGARGRRPDRRPASRSPGSPPTGPAR